MFSFLEKNRPALLVLLLGVLLMLLPGGVFSTGRGGDERTADFDTDEEKMAAVLSRIQGAGEVSVLLRQDGEGGAVVVCRGADSAEVRLRIVKAVSAYTGLGSDRIVVLRMEP